MLLIRDKVLLCISEQLLQDLVDLRAYLELYLLYLKKNQIEIKDVLFFDLSKVLYNVFNDWLDVRDPHIAYILVNQLLSIFYYEKSNFFSFFIDLDNFLAIEYNFHSFKCYLNFIFVLYFIILENGIGTLHNAFHH